MCLNLHCTSLTGRRHTLLNMFAVIKVTTASWVLRGVTQIPHFLKASELKFHPLLFTPTQRSSGPLCPWSSSSKQRGAVTCVSRTDGVLLVVLKSKYHSSIWLDQSDICRYAYMLQPLFSHLACKLTLAEHVPWLVTHLTGDVVGRVCVCVCVYVYKLDKTKRFAGNLMSVVGLCRRCCSVTVCTFTVSVCVTVIMGLL